MNARTRLNIRLWLVGITCLLMALGFSGCAVGACSMIRAVETDDTSPNQMAAKAGPLASGKSRIWVYCVEGAPSVAKAVVKFGGSLGVSDAMTFNDSARHYAGYSFISFDTPAGPYTVTTGKCRRTFGFYPGEIRKEMRFEPGTEYFIRIQYDDPTFRPGKPLDFVLMEKSAAMTEMQGLKYYKPGAKAYPVKAD
jgi:hypothetical protein